MVAALYITYGPLITMIYSAGKGVHEFVLDREGEYVLSEEISGSRRRGDLFTGRSAQGLDGQPSDVYQ